MKKKKPNETKVKGEPFNISSRLAPSIGFDYSYYYDDSLDEDREVFGKEYILQNYTAVSVSRDPEEYELEIDHLPPSR